MKRPPLGCLLGAGLCLAAGGILFVPASAADWSTERMSIQADTINIAPLSGVHQLRGAVTVERGPDRVAADWVELQMKDGELRLLTAGGTPVLFSSEARSHGRSGRTGPLLIEAAEIQYQVARKRVLARGRVRVDDNGRRLAGEHIVHDLRTGSYRIVGEKKGGVAVEIEEFRTP